MICEKINLIDGRDDVTLTTYVLADSPELLNGKKRPAVIVCPGGAYLSCSDREGEPIALAFARMGYHAFVLRYSILGGNGFEMMGTGKTVGPNPEKNYPQPMRELGMAMAYIKDHSDEWLVDRDRIAICGFSAGAHNCAMYEVYWNQPVIREYLNRPSEDLKPAACILGYPLTDYTFMKISNEGNPFATEFFGLSNDAFLGTREPSDEALREISPALNVNPDTPPTFIWSTAGDNMVPVQNSTLMATALANAKIPFEIHIFEEGDHGFALADQASSVAWSQTSPDASKWVSLCGCWLQKRFALPLPEKTEYEAMVADGIGANFS